MRGSRLRGGSNVYFAIFRTIGGDTYFKVGKSNDVEARVKSINTGVPGGITRCICSPKRNEAAAFEKERWLLELYSGEPSVATPVSGEWFHAVNPDMAEHIFRETNSELTEIEVAPPKMALAKRKRRTPTRKIRAAEVERKLGEWRSALEAGSERDPKSKGHAGVYGGTLMG